MGSAKQNHHMTCTDHGYSLVINLHNAVKRNIPGTHNNVHCYNTVQLSTGIQASCKWGSYSAQMGWYHSHCVETLQ